MRMAVASWNGPASLSPSGCSARSEEHTSEPSHLGISYAVFCLKKKTVKVEQTYVIPRENHNPIEMHATIAAWDGDRLTLWDKTQWVHNTADEIGDVFVITA